MPGLHEKLAVSLSALKELRKDGLRVFQSKALSRVDRDRLVRNGYLREVMKGWLISASPNSQDGDSTPWYAYFGEFCAQYCEERFGDEWHLSAEQSLLLYGKFRIGVDQLNRRAFPAAIQTLSRILTTHPELDEVRRTLALALFANSQHREAATEYEKLVHADSSDAALRLDLGVALREASLLDRVRQELEAVVRVRPDSARAHYQLGLLWLAQKDMGRAMEYFHQARRIDPNLQPPGSL